MFKEQIDKLDGFTFSTATDDVIARIRKTLNRQRNTLNTKSASIENKFLAILNYLAIFEIAVLVISLALDDLFGGTFYWGVVQIIIAVSIVAFAFILYRSQEKKL
jgi:hypothetical protein